MSGVTGFDVIKCISMCIYAELPGIEWINSTGSEPFYSTHNLQKKKMSPCSGCFILFLSFLTGLVISAVGNTVTNVINQSQVLHRSTK